MQEEVDKLLEQLDGLQEVCDTLPECSAEDGCATCKTNEKIKEIEQKIEVLEAKEEE